MELYKCIEVPRKGDKTTWGIFAGDKYFARPSQLNDVLYVCKEDGTFIQHIDRKKFDECFVPVSIIREKQIDLILL